MYKITVMIVDDHPVFRQGLRRVLESEDDLDVIAEVADGIEALQLARQMIPMSPAELFDPFRPFSGHSV